MRSHSVVSAEHKVKLYVILNSEGYDIEYSNVSKKYNKYNLDNPSQRDVSAQHLFVLNTDQLHAEPMSVAGGSHTSRIVAGRTMFHCLLA